MKKILLISGILLTLGLCTFIFYNIDNNKVVIENGDSKQLINTNALTMMYETTAGSGEYQVSTDIIWPQDGYTFNEQLSSCENGSKLTWDDENKKVIMSASISDKCYVYFDVEVITLANYIINEVYTGIDGDNDLYYHDGLDTYGTLEAEDNSYRYAGSNPNNYVCFGSDVTPCPDDNLYRIIGVFDDSKTGEYQIKLIKNTSIGSYDWSDEQDLNWNESVKPNIYAILNVTYYNEIENSWKSLIDKIHNWQVGGFRDSDLGTTKGTYDIEVGSGQNGYIEIMPIGLMYVSDYGYAANPNYWNISLSNYQSASYTNWMYLPDEWTISRARNIQDSAFVIDIYGDVLAARRLYNVRPVFYLNSDVEYISGTGTESDPFRIA